MDGLAKICLSVCQHQGLEIILESIGRQTRKHMQCPNQYGRCRTPDGERLCRVAHPPQTLMDW